MIKANELRVGNYVDCPRKNEMYCEIHTLCRYDKAIKLTDNPEGYLFDWDLDRIYGILLSEKWLLDFGFERQDFKELSDSWYYWTKRLSNQKYCDLSFHVTGGKDTFDCFIFPYEEAFRYQYVHQIQNLFFALTGQELTIKQEVTI